MTTTTLYHGSNDGSLTEILDRTTGAVNFGGIFFSSERHGAQGHGRHVYSCELDTSEIATSFKLGQHEPEEIEELGLDASEDEIDAAIDDSGESWDCQILRGRIARGLGYAAVEMSDEHGTSYLVFPGTDIARAD